MPIQSSSVPCPPAVAEVAAEVLHHQRARAAGARAKPPGGCPLRCPALLPRLRHDRVTLVVQALAGATASLGHGGCSARWEMGSASARAAACRDGAVIWDSQCSEVQRNADASTSHPPPSCQWWARRQGAGGARPSSASRSSATLLSLLFSQARTLARAAARFESPPGRAEQERGGCDRWAG